MSRTAAQVGNIVQRSYKETLLQPRHIRLRGIPSTVIPADIRRAISKNLEGVADVSLDYKGFRPTGDAYISLTRPDYLQDNMRKLENFSLLGIPVVATPTALEFDRPPRSRGVKGRAQAVERGAVGGDGPKGSFPNTQRNVVMWGLPGKLDPSAIDDALRDFRLARCPKGSPIILKVSTPEGEFSLYSRFLVTMASISEAHRLVRRLHLKYWDKQGKYQVYARVLH